VLSAFLIVWLGEVPGLTRITLKIRSGQDLSQESAVCSRLLHLDVRHAHLCRLPEPRAIEAVISVLQVV